MAVSHVRVNWFSNVLKTIRVRHDNNIVFRPPRAYTILAGYRHYCYDFTEQKLYLYANYNIRCVIRSNIIFSYTARFVVPV